MKKQSAFTLIELIIVIAIISILAGAIFVAIDPAKRLGDARNARRASDVATILDAVKKHQADNEGVLYGAINNVSDNVLYIIGTQSGGCSVSCVELTTHVNCVNFASIGAGYLAVIPVDPKSGTDLMTGYAIEKIGGGSGALAVYACNAEGEDSEGDDIVIKVTR